MYPTNDTEADLEDDLLQNVLESTDWSTFATTTYKIKDMHRITDFNVKYELSDLYENAEIKSWCTGSGNDGYNDDWFYDTLGLVTTTRRRLEHEEEEELNGDEPTRQQRWKYLVKLHWNY